MVERSSVERSLPLCRDVNDSLLALLLESPYSKISPEGRTEAVHASSVQRHLGIHTLPQLFTMSLSSSAAGGPTFSAANRDVAQRGVFHSREISHYNLVKDRSWPDAVFLHPCNICRFEESFS